MSVQLFGTTLTTNNVAAVVVAVVVLGVGIGATATGVLSGVGLDGATAQDQSLSTEVTLQSSNSSVAIDGSTTYDVVVESADGGVGAYDFAVTVDNHSVASFENVEVYGGSPTETTDVTVDDDGSTASAVVALANTSDTGSVTIATVTISGDNTGASELSLAVNALGTEDGDAYTVTETSGGTVTVEMDDSDS
jgi:hypothetical protein